MAKATKAQTAYRLENIAILRELLTDGKIIIVIKSVSSSGMTRRMRVYTSSLRDITSLCSNVLGWSENNKGINVGGCGMDMTFHLAYTLTYDLYSREERENLKGNGGGCLEWKTL